MSQLEERGLALRERQDSLRAELHEMLAKAGSYLLTKPVQDAGASLSQIRQRDLEVTEQISAVTAARDRIGEIEGRVVVVKNLIGEIQSEIRRLSDNMDSIYDEIGRIAFDLYRSNPLVDQEYADIFSPLVEVNSELSGIDASIGDQQTMLKTKPFLKKMVIRGRIVLLKNQRLGRAGSLHRLIRRAGRDILGTAFVDEIGDPKLTAATTPYRERVKNSRGREHALAKATDEISNLNQELERLGAAKRPHKRREELDEDFLTFARTRDTIRVELAETARDLPMEDLPAKCRPLFAGAGEIEQRLVALALLSDRVEAALDVEKFEDDSDRLVAEIKRKEAHHAELKKELAASRREKKETDLRLEEQRQARGSVDELLATDLLDDL